MYIINLPSPIVGDPRSIDQIRADQKDFNARASQD